MADIVSLACVALLVFQSGKYPFAEFVLYLTLLSIEILLSCRRREIPVLKQDQPPRKWNKTNLGNKRCAKVMIALRRPSRLGFNSNCCHRNIQLIVLDLESALKSKFTITYYVTVLSREQNQRLTK